MNRRMIVVFAALAAIVVPLSVLAQGAPGGETTPLKDLSDFTLWSMLGGPIVSLATALFNQWHWKSPVKLGVFFVFSCIYAGINSHFNGDLDSATWLRSLLVVLVAGLTSYMLTKPALQAIEVATTVTPAAA